MMLRGTFFCYFIVANSLLKHHLKRVLWILGVGEKSIRIWIAIQFSRDSDRFTKNIYIYVCFILVRFILICVWQKHLTAYHSQIETSNTKQQIKCMHMFPFPRVLLSGRQWEQAWLSLPVPPGVLLRGGHRHPPRVTLPSRHGGGTTGPDK